MSEHRPDDSRPPDEVSRRIAAIEAFDAFEADALDHPVDVVLRRIAAFEALDVDALDLVERVEELREEFGHSTVNRAVRLLAARAEAEGLTGSRYRDHPLWDRDLDG